MLAAQDVRKEGWVLKESAVFRAYRKRWVVLTRERIYSFKRERCYVDPTEDIDLRQCGTVKSADDLTNRAFSFTVQVPGRNFYFVAASDAERNEWVAAVGRATTERRRVRSYSEEVEYQEQQARLAAAEGGGGGANANEEEDAEAPVRRVAASPRRAPPALLSRPARARRNAPARASRDADSVTGRRAASQRGSPGPGGARGAQG